MSSAASTCKRFHIGGIVQGVGFRPFVYALALRFGIVGSVENSGSGVIIVAQATQALLEAFENALQDEAPPLSRIDTIACERVTCNAFSEFAIIESAGGQKSAAVSPDIAICDDCLAELKDPNNRRYRYFLNNCTNCGPRYSIIKTLPYDRHNTSMHPFTMCSACEREYTDPLDRRYHAQPVSCHECGPALTLYDGKENLLGAGDGVITEAAARLKRGEILAIKGLGGFHLMCDALNDEAIAQLRARKRRKSKPLAVMFRDIQSALEEVQGSLFERRLLESKERPIVLLKKRRHHTLAEGIAPGIDRFGVMLAYTPLQHLLFEHLGTPLVATSANFSDEPIYRSKAQIFQNLGNVVDAVVESEREILNAIDDSVVQAIGDRLQVLRMGRGFAPLSLPLHEDVTIPTLAVGAQQKSAIALAFERQLILSPHIGDLGSVEAMEYFERTLHTFQTLYEVTPQRIVCDAHPGYMSTQWAKEQGKALLQVQHHYAHALACMFEHGLREEVLAFAFDGTGYGSDGSIWGGEVLTCNPHTFTRAGHLKPFRLIGGDLAVKEPRRIALGLLFECFGREKAQTLKLPLLDTFSAAEVETMRLAWEKGLNAPLASSMGRLFDAVASLMDLLHVSDYEGQSGMRLEAFCVDEHASAFSFAIDNGVIDISGMICEIVALSASAARETIADRFINTLIAVMDAFAQEHPELPLLFCGGVFQNKTLLERTLKHFKNHKRLCYVQSHTPVNDGAIALGQMAYALYNQGASCVSH